MRDPCARPIEGAAPGRLTKRREFLAAASGRRFHTERMTVQGLVRDDASGLRFGLTVTKKVGHATERNRIRRRLRQAFRHAAVDHGGGEGGVGGGGGGAAPPRPLSPLFRGPPRALGGSSPPPPAPAPQGAGRPPFPRPAQ